MIKILDKIDAFLEKVGYMIIDRYFRITMTFLGLLVLISFIFFVWAVGRI
jgi:hypothetical protein